MLNVYPTLESAPSYPDLALDYGHPALPAQEVREPSSVPPCLRQFSPGAAWVSVRPDELQASRWSGLSHVYLGDIRTGAYPPNQVLAYVHSVLPDNAWFAFRLATAENVKHQLRERLPAAVFSVCYFSHFLVRRVLPKLKGFRKISRLLSLTPDLSKAEIMGRVLYHGFTIEAVREEGNHTILITRKDPIRNPSTTAPAPSEGFLFRMPRIGQHGKTISVYKLRSMHPYAEYVQEYLYQNHGLDAGGKFKDDFRVSTGGRVLRKYWIDELPMLYNLLKGDMKLIGVRPISKHYLGLYPEHARQARTRYKPGLIPPFYADLPETFDDIVQSELNYLAAYEASPLRTDAKYLLKILHNILVKKARSK
jgi:lipopolysaccharide/colanic/teichoic acid biosynthesis glycosyltransferase